jgi:hypothetical protein
VLLVLSLVYFIQHRLTACQAAASAQCGGLCATDT